MNFKSIHNVYFIGIGGIGMSALARYFKFMGKEVAGYDKTKTPLTTELEASGIPIVYKDEVAIIPHDFLDAKNTLVVYTPAIPKNHQQYQYFINREFVLKKRAEVLGLVTANTFCFAVAGTHGKTTTSAILAHLLKESGVGIAAFLGGISENFNSNFWFEKDDVTVAEADEFDRSFLHLSPNVACITSMDADHLDIYENENNLKDSFVAFSKKVKPNGALIVKKGLPIAGLTYGIEDGADYEIKNLTITNGGYYFDIKTPYRFFKNVVFNKPGHHNLLNALAAFSMALQIELDEEKLVAAMATFKGVKRRFSYQIKSTSRVFIDDYAHHPTEINALHQAVREMYPNKKVLAIFQPHLYSRTRDFIDEFAKSLEQFDQVVLLDIYPAREEPLPGVTSSWLLNKINNPAKVLLAKQELPAYVKQSDAFVILTIGAGDISEEVPIIKHALTA